MDGGLSNIQPRLPDSSDVTLTVSPFSGDADICPADPPSNLEMVVGSAVLKFSMTNNLRILNGLYPTDLEVRPFFLFLYESFDWNECYGLK